VGIGIREPRDTKQRRWEQKNLDKVIAYRKKYYKENFAKMSAYGKKYRLEHPPDRGEESKRSMLWKQKNIEKVRVDQKKTIETLGDSYVKTMLKSAGIKSTTESMNLKRAQISMKRTLREFKKWRDENESNYSNV